MKLELGWKQHEGEWTLAQAAVMQALSNPRWAWRTVNGIVKVSKLKHKVVTETLSELNVCGVILVTQDRNLTMKFALYERRIEISKALRGNMG